MIGSIIDFVFCFKNVLRKLIARLSLSEILSNYQKRFGASNGCPGVRFALIDQSVYPNISLSTTITH